MDAYEIAKLGDTICLLISLGCLFLILQIPETDLVKNTESHEPLLFVWSITKIGWFYFLLAKISMRFITWFMELTNYNLLIRLHMT